MSFVKVGKIPAQTQLQTALAINMGSEGKQVPRNYYYCMFWGNVSFSESICSKIITYRFFHKFCNVYFK